MRAPPIHRPRRHSDLLRQRPRMTELVHPSAADEVRTSDLFLAITGVALLGGLCLMLANGLLGSLLAP